MEGTIEGEKYRAVAEDVRNINCVRSDEHSHAHNEWADGIAIV